DETTLRRDYGPFTHAARALCLWRSCDPYDAWRSGQGTIAVDDDTVVDSTHTDELSISLENRGPRS
ncbi:MAG: hypothetical protein KDA63_13180, partial [Planctomycetales bacterium]|nr:hypothetical protein [Planctomycetales bacterium]